MKALAKAFDEIAMRSSIQSLPTLILQSAVIFSDGTRLLPDAAYGILVPDAIRGITIPQIVWYCATRTWNLTLRALAASQLRIENHDGFNGPGMIDHGIPCDQFDMDRQLMAGLTEPFKLLKSLSLRICDRVFETDDEGGNRLTVYPAEAANEENFVGISKLIKVCPRLASLDLRYHHRYLRKVEVLQDFPFDKILQYVAELNQLPKLQALSLYGLTTSGEVLLDLITRTAPVSLSLKHVRLRHGTFDPIFAYCRSDEANVEAMYLQNLCECGIQTVQFKESQAPFNQTWGKLVESAAGKGRGQAAALACRIKFLYFLVARKKLSI